MPISSGLKAPSMPTAETNLFMPTSDQRKIHTPGGIESSASLWDLSGALFPVVGIYGIIFAFPARSDPIGTEPSTPSGITSFDHCHSRS